MRPPRLASRLAGSLARAAELASTRFPVAALLVVALSVLANAEVAGVSLLPQETTAWWIAAAYAAAVASVLVRLALEARGAGDGLLRSAPLLAALMVGALVRYAEPFGVFAPALVAAISLAVPLAPYVGRPGDRRFWTFALWTTVGVTLAFVSVLLFTLGVSAILEMIRFLFEIGLSSRAYEHIYTTALTLVGPLIALGRIPRDFDETVGALGSDDRMAQGVRFLFDWVAAPLALATAVVLHLYAAKILATGELPKNEVGWIVTSFALLVLSLRIAADPFLAEGGLFARGFARAWAPMLAVPLGLLAVAVGQRVGGEGWTLERYYLALGALASMLILVAQVIPGSRRSIRLIAGIPLSLLALSSVGPLGVAATVMRSQADRISALVDRADALPPEVAAEVRSRIGALADVAALERLTSALPAYRRAAVLAALADEPGDAADRVAVALGAAYVAPEPAAPGRVFASARPKALITTGYDLMLPDRVILRQGGEATYAEGVSVVLGGADLVLRLGETTERFPLQPIVDAVPAGTYDAQAMDTSPVDAETTNAAGRTVRLRLQRLTLEAGGQARDLTATLLLRRRDWPSSPLFGGGAEAGAAEPGGAIGQRPR